MVSSGEVLAPLSRNVPATPLSRLPFQGTPTRIAHSAGGARRTSACTRAERRGALRNQRAAVGPARLRANLRQGRPMKPRDFARALTPTAPRAVLTAALPLAIACAGGQPAASPTTATSQPASVSAPVAPGVGSPLDAGPSLAPAGLGPVDLLERAKRAVSAGRDSEALELLLTCFDHGLDADRSFIGLWGSVLPARLAELAARYAPAAAAANARLDRIAEQMSARPDRYFASAAMYVSLASALGQPERVLTLFDSLHGRGLGADGAQYFLVRWGLDIFFGARRYADISLHAERLAADLTSAFPAAAVGALAGRNAGDQLREERTRQVASVFSSLLRTHKEPGAWAVADRLTTRSPTLHAYAALVDSARAAGSATMARRLVAKARTALPAEQTAALQASAP